HSYLLSCFCVLDPAPPHTHALSLHDALPIFARRTFALSASRTPCTCLPELVSTPRYSKTAMAYATPACIEGDGDPDGASSSSTRSEEHTSELQSLTNLVCRLLLEKKNNTHPR